MSGFRFRAQAALDLRRRELDAARRELARAEQDRGWASRCVEEATAAAREARVASGNAIAASHSATELQWYRFWILRLDHERGAAASVLAARDRDVATAAAACLRARQRCEALERLRSRALAAWQRAELEAERKLIDELATRKYVTHRRNSEGSTHGSGRPPGFPHEGAA